MGARDRALRLHGRRSSRVTSRPTLAKTARAANSIQRDVGDAAGHAFGSAIDRAVTAHITPGACARSAGSTRSQRTARVGLAGVHRCARETRSKSSSTAPRSCRWSPTSWRRRSRTSIVTGCFFSPELELTRGDEPTIVRNLLAELAERIDVRVLIWSGAPVPIFSPSRREVREMVERFNRRNRIRCEFDSCVRFMHCHHEKTIVIDDRVAFVGGIDLTLDGGDPYDSQEHPSRGVIGWHDVAMRIEGPAVADVAEHFRLRWHAAAKEDLPAPPVPEAAGKVDLQIVRTIPEKRVRALAPARRLLRARVLCRRIPLGRAVHLHREPVPLVVRDRRDPRGEASQPAQRRLPHPRPPPRERERRRRHLTRPGRRAHPRGRRQRALPRLLGLRAHRQPARPHLRPREGRDRRRPLADHRLGEPERALALQRLGGQRRHPRRGAWRGTRACGSGRSTSSFRSRRSTEIRRPSSTSGGSRSRRSSSIGCRTISR